MRPTAATLLSAAGGKVPDLIRPNLRILFCGINPGLYSAFTRHHFARPGNRFWPALHAAGFTDRVLDPREEQELLTLGYGITNLVNFATASAAELTPGQLVAGGRVLLAKTQRYTPQVVAILGVSAYRLAFRKDHAEIGKQPDRFGPSVLWILPNPSGLNAHYTPKRLAASFRELHEWCRNAC